MTSIAFAVAAVTLARRKVLTRELPAVEGLARVDVLCIDKTGTITEPHPAFERVELLGEPVSTDGDGAGDGRRRPEPHPAAEALALQVLGAMAGTASHANSTLSAIGEAIAAPPGWTVEDTVPFSSARKWSAARIDRPRLLGARRAGDRGGRRQGGGRRSRRPGSRAGGRLRRGGPAGAAPLPHRRAVARRDPARRPASRSAW